MYSVYCLTLINSNFSYMFLLCFYSLFHCYLYYTSLKFKDTALCYNVFLCDLPQLPAHSLRYKGSSNNKGPLCLLNCFLGCLMLGNLCDFSPPAAQLWC